MEEHANSDGVNLILRELHRRIEFAQKNDVGNVEVEKAVLEHGQSFVGTNLPKGFRKRKERYCYRNAGYLASTDCGIYVEGYALVRGDWPTHHAWITLDGRHAIDVTLRAEASETSYFGIPFSPRVFRRWASRRVDDNGGDWGPLFDWQYAPFDELLNDIESDPVRFQFSPAEQTIRGRSMDR